jgi:Fe-S-cluster containining protein
MKSEITGKIRVGECLKCGKCCVIDWIKDFEYDGTYEFMELCGVDSKEFNKLFEGKNVCKFLNLETKLCNSYDQRRKLCKEYPKDEYDSWRHGCKGFTFE